MRGCGWWCRAESDFGEGEGREEGEGLWRECLRGCWGVGNLSGHAWECVSLAGRPAWECRGEWEAWDLWEVWELWEEDNLSGHAWECVSLVGRPT